MRNDVAKSPPLDCFENQLACIALLKAADAQRHERKGVSGESAPSECDH